MSNKNDVPWLSASAIEAISLKVLQSKHPPLEIPIPVERIVEIGFGLDIVSVLGLSNFDCVGYIDGALNAIYVDQYVYQKRPSRFRFTLAHELSHLILHEAFYSSFGSCNSVADWKAATLNIPEEAHIRMEWQANMFAGYFLVPSGRLVEQAANAAQLAQNNNLDPSKPDIQAYMEKTALANAFSVSSEVISIRVRNDNIWGKVL